MIHAPQRRHTRSRRPLIFAGNRGFSDEIDRIPFADLIRTGNAQGLLRNDWPAWRRFREMRARTSHTYDARSAAEVAAAIPAFLEEAEHLYAELQRRVA